LLEDYLEHLLLHEDNLNEQEYRLKNEQEFEQWQEENFLSVDDFQEWAQNQHEKIKTAMRRLNEKRHRK